MAGGFLTPFGCWICSSFSSPPSLLLLSRSRIEKCRTDPWMLSQTPGPPNPKSTGSSPASEWDSSTPACSSSTSRYSPTSPTRTVSTPLPLSPFVSSVFPFVRLLISIDFARTGAIVLAQRSRCLFPVVHAGNVRYAWRSRDWFVNVCDGYVLLSSLLFSLSIERELTCWTQRRYSPSLHSYYSSTERPFECDRLSPKSSLRLRRSGVTIHRALVLIEQ